MGKKVLVPIAHGTEEIEACCIIDILRRAELDVTVASVQEMQITASRGVFMVADKHISQCVNETYDLIALPGGLPGAEHLRDSADLIDMLKKQVASGRLYAAICASPVVILKHHNLLEGKKATAYPGMAEQLDITDAIVENVVVDGNCITSKGPGTAMEFSVKLIELLLGADKADEIAGQLLLK